MKLAVGSFRVRSFKFPSYDDMERFVTADGHGRDILGLNAAAFISFWALEAIEPFGIRRRRYGLVMEQNNGGPDVLALPSSTFLVGLNSQVVLVDLAKHSTREIDLHGWFSAFIEQGNVVAVIHELGALALRLPECEIIGSLATTGIVTEATLSNRKLILMADDDSKVELDLGE